MDLFYICHVNIYCYFSVLLGGKKKKGVVPLVAVEFPEKREVFRGFEGCCSVKLQNCFRGKLKQTYFFIKKTKLLSSEGEQYLQILFLCQHR